VDVVEGTETVKVNVHRFPLRDLSKSFREYYPEGVFKTHNVKLLYVQYDQFHFEKNVIGGTWQHLFNYLIEQLGTNDLSAAELTAYRSKLCTQYVSICLLEDLRSFCILLLRINSLGRHVAKFKNHGPGNVEFKLTVRWFNLSLLIIR
jgi:hypothetical protein